MRFPVMHRRMRNARAGTRSTARSASSSYTPPVSPVADAGNNQTVLVGETVSFDGSGSSGTNLSYSWDFGTDATPATDTGLTPTCSYSTTGAKTVTLTVTDDNGATDSDTVTITVHSAPIAEAGNNQDVSVNKTVTFDGSGSRDPDGGNLTYSWDFGTDATPSTGSGATPSCSYSMTGAKTVTLTVTDDEGVSRSDTVTITVHSLPVARAGSTQIVFAGDTVNFDGSGSTGTNLSYSWDFGTDATPATDTGLTPTCSYSTTGAKTVTLTVTDDNGATDSDTVTITVHSAPIAEAGNNQDVSVNKTVTFDGSGSRDPDGGELIYSWAFGTDATPSTGSAEMPSCSYSTTGAKTVTLTVTDDEGVSRSDTVTITVHSLPVAEAGNNQTVLVDATVSFDGSGSTGSNLTYSWDFGAYATSATGTGAAPSCTYSRPGAKIVTLTVTDAAGATASDTVIITVTSVDSTMPDAEAGDDQTVLVGETVSFDGSGSTGNNLIYSWAFGTDATPATGSGLVPTCSYSTIGAKTVRLTVTDDEEATASDTVTITVHNAPIADAGSDQRVAVGSEVSFDGSGSSDPDGGNLTYLWDFGADADPPTAEGVMPFCIYSARGAKTVTLTVTDDEGVSRSNEVTITVYNPPVADAGNDQEVTLGSEVSFDGSGSRDPDGGNLTYSWDFGADADPATSNAEMPLCIYSTPGTKTVTLTVTDDEGATASDTVIITVIDPVMPWCTSELPAEPPAVIELAPIPPSPPTYAVPVRIGGTEPPPEPVLALQADRLLNDLEKAAIDLVFKGSPSFSPTMLSSTVRVNVEEEWILPDGGRADGSQGNGVITIYRSKHIFTDAIDANTGLVNIFKPGNLFYLNTFIHEAAHWWQDHQHRYQIHLQNPETTAERYDFDYYQLRDLAFDDQEAHASAVATWFIIAWQLEHRPDDQLINLTQKGRHRDEHVGKMNRYTEIAKIAFRGTSATNVTSPPVGTWITREDAEQLACHFKPLIEEVRTAQPLPASD